jgi:hypothetical protein
VTIINIINIRISKISYINNNAYNKMKMKHGYKDNFMVKIRLKNLIKNNSSLWISILKIEIIFFITLYIIFKLNTYYNYHRY